MKAPRYTSSRLTLALLAGVAMMPVLLSMPQARAEIGVAAAVNTDAKGQAPGGAPRVLALGQKVVFNERISTDASGQAQILLLDGTTFTVGPNSDLAIDEFVFNPETGNAKVVASVTRGAFRFIGAKTSQSPGGVTINTQVGTIGVRGGSVVCGMSGGQFVCMMPFGKSVNIQAKDGSSHTIFKSGWLLAFDADGNFIEERKAKPQEVGVITAALNGKGNGGTPKPPSDGTVQTSDVPPNNSGLPLIIPVSVLMEAVKSNPRVETIVDNKAQDDIDQDINENPPGPTTLGARLLTAPTTYTNADGQTFNNPGPRGLVGTGDADEIVLLYANDGRLVSTNGQVDLPDYSGTEGDPDTFAIMAEELTVTDGVINGQSVSGTAYAGAGDFVAYMLGVNGDPTQPVYLIYGTPTSNAVVGDMLASANIREYSLTQDPIRGNPLPFFADDLYATQLESDAFAEGTYNASNLIVVEGNGGNTRAMQSSISITGSGASQSSAAVVFNGTVAFNETAGEYQLEGGRRGSVRYNAEVGSANLRGGIESIGGGQSAGEGTGSHFFGPNADNFVVGTPIDDEPDNFSEAPAYENGPFSGNPADGYAGDSAFGTHHVASLESETPQGDLSRVSKTGLQGFMVGTATSNTNGNTYTVADNSNIDICGDCSEPPVVEVETNLTLDLSASNNSVVATATVHDSTSSSDVDNLLLAFGDGNAGTSTFVDNDRYSAKRAVNPELTRVRLDGDSTPSADLPQLSNVTAGSYMISGRANPIAGYEHCESCDFIEWGWWGTSIDVDDDPGPDVNIRRESVHMGTWVAGELSTEDQIYAAYDESDEVGDLPFGGSANYQGTAIGTVTRNVSDTPVQYIARGDVEMDYDFANRYGTMTISNFDGSDGFDPINASGEMLGSTTDGGKFGGNLSSNNPYGEYYESLYGQAAGSFVNDPNAELGAPNVAAGMIGSFNLSGTGVSISGTIAGVGQQNVLGP